MDNKNILSNQYDCQENSFCKKRKRGKLISFASTANFGKSSMAIKLFLFLLEQNINVEFIQESIKHHYYQSTKNKNPLDFILNDQKTIKRALKQKDVVIYNSSFLSPYCYKDVSVSSFPFLEKYVLRYREQDILIHIPLMEVPFNQSGRYQKNKEECERINKHFKDYLNKIGISYLNAYFSKQDLLNETILSMLSV